MCSTKAHTRKTETASGIMARTVAAPCTSMRSTTSVLLASASTTCREQQQPLCKKIAYRCQLTAVRRRSIP